MRKARSGRSLRGRKRLAAHVFQFPSIPVTSSIPSQTGGRSSPSSHCRIEAGTLARSHCCLSRSSRCARQPSPASQRTTAVVPTTRACGMGGFQISNATIPIAATPNHQISKTRKLVIPGSAVIRFTTNPCRGVPFAGISTARLASAGQLALEAAGTSSRRWPTKKIKHATPRLRWRFAKRNVLSICVALVSVPVRLLRDQSPVTTRRPI